jgi:hypothetical protein
MSMRSLYPIFSILAVSSITTGCVAVIVAVARFLSSPKCSHTVCISLRITKPVDFHPKQSVWCIYTIWSKVSRHPCNSKLKPRCHCDCIYRYKRRKKAVCCSLLSSTSKMGNSGELSYFERGLVIGCHISKKSVRDTATLLKFPKSMDDDVIAKWKCKGTTTMQPWPGRPHLMTNRGHRAFKKVVHETCQTSSETITREFRSATNCSASTMTVHWELRGMGFHGRAAAHKPNILPVNAKCRLKLCK